MPLLKYLQQEGQVHECGALSKKETEQVNECVRRVLVPSSARENAKAGQKRSATRGTYTGYTPKERTKIGRYAAESGPDRASRHFSVPETTARRLKSEYLQKLKIMRASEDVAVPVVKSLPTKPQGRPLLLGLELNHECSYQS